jgi:hypothetical protein
VPEIIKNEKLRAKAQFLRTFNNPGLKSGVIDNELIVDFSPKPAFFKNNSKLASKINSCIINQY